MGYRTFTECLQLCTGEPSPHLPGGTHGGTPLIEPYPIRRVCLVGSAVVVIGDVSSDRLRESGKFERRLRLAILRHGRVHLEVCHTAACALLYNAPRRESVAFLLLVPSLSA